MGCNMSYNPAFDGPLIQQAPPSKPCCDRLVVPQHAGAWGFILQQRLFSMSGNDFTVRNMLGQDIVVVSGKVFSLSRRTMMRSVDGSPIVEISKKILGFHSTHFLTNPATGKVIATARMRISSFFPTIELYEGEAYDQPAALLFTLGGDIFGLSSTSTTSASPRPCKQAALRAASTPSATISSPTPTWST
jgi:hypothetical protein